MNDTQFAYTLQMDNQQKTQEEVNLLELEGAEEEKNEDYDKNLDFIFIVRPFKQDFCRVEYPFTNDKFTNILEDSQNSNKSQRVLFINENILIAAQNNQIKIANTSVFFEDEKDSTTVSAQKRFKYFKCKQQAFCTIKFNGKGLKGFNIGDQKKNGFRKNAKIDDGRIFGDLEREGYDDEELRARMAMMENNRPIYSDQKMYDQFLQVQLIDFKSIMMGMQWKVLTIYQRVDEQGNEEIIIYAAQRGCLELQAFSLNVDMKEPPKADEEGDNEEKDEQTSQEHKTNQDLIQLDCYNGIKTQGDEYASITITQLSEKDTLAVFRTKDGHIDITTDQIIYDFNFDMMSGQERKTDVLRVTQKDQSNLRGGKVINTVVTRKYFHLELQMYAKEGKKPGNKVIRYNLDFADRNKINYNQRAEYHTLIDSLVSDQFVKKNLTVFSDVKLVGGLLVLTHGQIVSFYSVEGERWFHFFNKKEISRGNTITKQIIEEFRRNGGLSDSQALLGDYDKDMTDEQSI